MSQQNKGEHPNRSEGTDRPEERDEEILEETLDVCGSSRLWRKNFECAVQDSEDERARRADGAEVVGTDVRVLVATVRLFR